MIFKNGVDPDIQPYFKDRLQEVEDILGWPLVITSGYREGDDGCHGQGLAVDIRCTAASHRFDLLSVLLEHGFCRIGIYDRHIHADLCKGSLAQHVLWTGVSK